MGKMRMSTSVWRRTSDVSAVNASGDGCIGCPLTQWRFSILYHPASKMSPYKATFGQLPLAISNYAPGSTTVGTVEDSLKTWTMILQILKEVKGRLTSSSESYETNGGEFQVGDVVYLYLIPYRHITIARQSLMKLSPCYYGPLHVLQRIGQVLIGCSCQRALGLTHFRCF